MNMKYDDMFNEQIEKWILHTPSVNTPYPTIFTDAHHGFPVKKEGKSFFF